MYPNQPDQNQNNQYNPQQNIPPQSPDHGAWDFLNTPEPQKPESFFSRYKKLIIVAGSSIAILIILAVAAALTAPKSNDSSNASSSSPVTLQQYSGAVFSVDYPESLQKSIDEALVDPNGWLLELSEDADIPGYKVSVTVSDQPSGYVDTVEAINELPTDPPNLKNVSTTKVKIGDIEADKSIGDFTDVNGEERQVIFTETFINGKSVYISAIYKKSNTDISNGFDAMAASFRLN